MGYSYSNPKPRPNSMLCFPLFSIRRLRGNCDGKGLRANTMDRVEKSSRDLSRQEIAAEVLELGEMLFDTAIDAATQRPAGEEVGDAVFVEEMRAAADEFFTALRLL